MSTAEQSCGAFLDALASKAPTPGGGAAAAGDRGLGGQGVQKVLRGLLSSMHKTFSFP